MSVQQPPAIASSAAPSHSTFCFLRSVLFLFSNYRLHAFSAATNEAAGIATIQNCVSPRALTYVSLDLSRTCLCSETMCVGLFCGSGHMQFKDSAEILALSHIQGLCTASFLVVVFLPHTYNTFTTNRLAARAEAHRRTQ